MEEGKKYKLGLIGYPIKHSLSPHFFMDEHPEVSYDLIETSRFQEAFATFKKGGYDAVNVTAPFKEQAFKAADAHDSICEKIGASNLLISKNNKILAFNTDREGVIRSIWKGIEMYSGHITDINLKVLVVGCGGAGKAATAASLDMGFATTIANRTFSKCADFVSRLNSHHTTLPIAAYLSELPALVRENDIIIYTIPQKIPELRKMDFSKKIVIEANYHNPSIDKERAAIYIDGKKWLHAQAEAAWSTILNYL